MVVHDFSPELVVIITWRYLRVAPRRDGSCFVCCVISRERAWGVVSVLKRLLAGEGNHHSSFSSR